MERRAIVVQGIVQGVGFRPFVHQLAVRWRLGGFVQNCTGSVRIEVEGEPAQLERFLEELARRPPPLARIEHLSWERREPRGDQHFHIAASGADAETVFIAPDAATCADCLSELFDPSNRRHGYPFINCTHCGPRLTIVTGAPYDRLRTTMAGFPMCPACRMEYDDPADRRFHAQPTACPACGPRLRLRDAAGAMLECADPVAAFAAALGAGRIGALKGLGGYHLACVADDDIPVAELRRRKHREEKPLAVMVRDLAAAERLCHLDAAECALLLSSARPIVLLRKRPAIPIAPAVAPGNPRLGILLPYTPLHHLLVRAVGGRPLVLTSGNRADEPIAYRADDAVHRLAGIADLFLDHDRPIQVRCDDSVTCVVQGQELPLRRSRGYAPAPLALPLDCPCPIAALGGQLKATFALGRGRQAFLSHHLGDLDHLEAYQAFVQDFALFQDLFQVRPECLAHDLHPDYLTTRFATAAAAQSGGRLVGVQHHHAHLASCMAEHGLTEPVIGITFDGTGYGPDGTVWGGEFLVGAYDHYQRAAHLRYVPMPGGDQAIREPWRMALAHLADAGAACPALERRVAPAAWRAVHSLLDRHCHSPRTSSIGRLFDAVAALAGIRDRVRHEGQAAMELEWLATTMTEQGSYPFAIMPAAAAVPLVVDSRPLITAVAADAARGVDRAVIARRFHQTLVDIIARVSGRIRSATGLHTVVLSGGVFLNALLTGAAVRRLQEEGFQVYRHRQVPPGDGGLCLGQLAIACATLRSHSQDCPEPETRPLG